MSTKNNNVSTAATALILCLVCSVMVSAVAVGLKPKQQENARLDLNKNILMAADMYDPETESADVIAERFADFEIRLVNLQTGQFATEQEITASGISDVNSYNVSKAARTPSLSTSLTNDIAKIGGKPILPKYIWQKMPMVSLSKLCCPFMVLVYGDQFLVF